MTTAIDASSAAPTRFTRDVVSVLSRELRPTLRDPFSLIFSLVQPLFFLGLFGPLLVATTDAPAAQTLQWFVPGILVMVALFGTGTIGANLLDDIMAGSHERTLVAPISRSALLVGRALKEIVPLMVQGLLVVLVALPFGFSLSIPGLALGLLVLAVFGVGFGALSYSLALAVVGREWMFWVVHQTVLFPLLILSGMLLPVDAGPGWMKIAAAINPIGYVVEAERALFAGNLASPDVLGGVIAAVVIAVIGLIVGTRSMRRAG
ncbi:ABC transporter permease [Paramicrobacterium agarici]|uniref:ABC transporter permease n=1 Tax=Paramicrobacterium agarici TaxID=630514 RepID=UPI00114DB82A|nr:ABC transporter permease [Microbacterium agarici]TQO22455.1 ABC-2 type transport system permease protein [Microbacterium agarici]